MNKIVKQIIGWAVYLSILAGLIYGIPKALAYFLHTPYPMASITSGSMWPALKKGDLVFIQGISDKSQIQEGDVVVYRNEQGFTIHRVIGLSEDTLLTKGDANNGPDAPISYQLVVGKAVEWGEKPFRLPLVGNIGLWVNKPGI